MTQGFNTLPFPPQIIPIRNDLDGLLTTIRAVQLSHLNTSALRDYLDILRRKLQEILGTLQADNFTILPVSRGGTGMANYAIGDLIYATATQTLDRLPIGSDGQVLRASATGPLWGKVRLGGDAGTTDISGVLQPASGGLGSTTVPSVGQIPIGNGSVYAVGSLTPGDNIQIVEGPGQITIHGNQGGLDNGVYLRWQSNTQVKLTKAQTISFDDGPKVRNWTEKTADITVAGAGGLDTGSERTNRWYEVYAIGKSTDGRRTRVMTSDDALILHLSPPAARTLSMASDGVSVRGLRTTNDLERIAQGFVVGSTDVVMTAVEVEMAVNNVAYMDPYLIWVTIQGSTGTSLLPNDGDVKGTSGTKPARITQNVQVFTFATPITLLAGQKYWIVLHGDYPISAVGTQFDTWLTENVIALPYSYPVNMATYTNGAGTPPLNAWKDATPAMPGGFKIIASPIGNSDLVLPNGYLYSKLIGYVYNDISGNFRKFWQVNRMRRAWGPLADYECPAVTTTLDPAWLDVVAGSYHKAVMPNIPIIAHFSGVSVNINAIMSVVDADLGTPTAEGSSYEGAVRLTQFDTGAANYFTGIQPMPLSGPKTFTDISGGTGTLYLPGWEF